MRRAALALALLSTLAGAPTVWAVCDGDVETICPGHPCVIDKIYTVDQYCTLDFSGKDVTIAPAGALYWPMRQDGSDADLYARSFTVQGTIEATNASLYFYTDDAFRVLGPGPARVFVATVGADDPAIFAGFNVETGGDV